MGESRKDRDTLLGDTHWQDERQETQVRIQSILIRYKKGFFPYESYHILEQVTLRVCGLCLLD